MERIQSIVSAAKVKECLLGSPIDVATFNDEQIETCAVLMLHCCMNGPVSVHKHTTFPEGKVGSIESLLGVPMTNNSWNRTCVPFARWLAGAGFPEVQQCQQVRLLGALWPLHGRSGALKANHAA